ncbi:MAG: FAD-binding protein [archaeon]
MEKEFFDTIIIGRGLAGLSAAIQSTKNRNTAVFYCGKESNANSFKAQGGVAAALSKNDSAEKHFNDTIRTGDGLSNQQAARILVQKGKKKVLELIELGFQFDENSDGIDFGLEAGHSEKRVLHAKGDETGKELTKFFVKLAEEKNIHFFRKELKEVIAAKGTAQTAVFEDFTAEFSSLIFASGGYSALYAKSTNPESTKGTALSIALKAGMQLMDLEFEQFHPTTVKGNNFLLSETLRGEGAFLVNDANEKFMENIHGKDLATRDVVSVEIMNQIKSGKKVFLDCTGIKNLKERFPSIYSKTKELGLKIESDLIEVEPAAHYSIGGIKADLNTRTNLRNVFAAGECSCNGVHGANRLASNSLLEAIVFGAIAGENALKEKNNRTASKKIKTKEYSDEKKEFDLNYLKELMWKYAGIRRKKDRMEKALNEINKMPENNLALLAGKIIESALKRKESRGCHFRTDFPETKKAFHSVTKK